MAVDIKIIEEGPITSQGDLLRLNIVDWNRYTPYWRSPQDAMERISSWFINTSAYSIVRMNLHQFPERDDFPAWNHVGSNHQALARVFWNSFHYTFKGDLNFSDCPDFEGEYLESTGKVRFRGDIGKASPIAVREGTHDFGPGDTWISVIDGGTLIFIEFFVKLATA